MKKLIVTSFTGREDRLERQLIAASSWAATGIEVVAVQSQADMADPDLTELLAEMRESIGRDNFGVIANEMLSSPPTIQELIVLGMLWQPPRDLLLLNSDCELLENAPAVLHNFEAVDRRMLLLRRSNDGKQFSDFGVEGVCFRPSAMSVRGAELFRFGRPWWDLVVPYCWLTSGGRLVSHVAPICYHEPHEPTWDPKFYRQIAPLAAGVMRRPYRPGPRADLNMNDEAQTFMLEQVETIDLTVPPNRTPTEEGAFPAYGVGLEVYAADPCPGCATEPAQPDESETEPSLDDVRAVQQLGTDTCEPESLAVETEPEPYPAEMLKHQPKPKRDRKRKP